MLNTTDETPEFETFSPLPQICKPVFIFLPLSLKTTTPITLRCQYDLTYHIYRNHVVIWKPIWTLLELELLTYTLSRLTALTLPSVTSTQVCCLAAWSISLQTSTNSYCLITCIKVSPDQSWGSSPFLSFYNLQIERARGKIEEEPEKNRERTNEGAELDCSSTGRSGLYKSPSFLISSSRWKSSGRRDYAGQLRFLPKTRADQLLGEP